VSVAKVYKFSHVRISTTTLQLAAKSVLNSPNDQSNHFHLIAASTFFRINSNVDLQNSLRDGINFCDSRPLCSWITLKFQKCPQIRGTDLLREVLEQSNKDAGHFFIGTTKANLDVLKALISSRYPQVKISGSFAPPFSTPSDADLTNWANSINESGARIVWIGLGSPKQDLVAAKLSEQCQVNIVAAGAAIDFFTGNKKESPKVLQVMHMEWLFRFAQEPRRLWRRYTLGSLYFIYLIFMDMLKKVER
jgi:N-acetylglucosaminyldiphosphoundecaprenol N-acetyl-beta-D-mannosaminyltransferase